MVVLKEQTNQICEIFKSKDKLAMIDSSKTP